MFINIRVAMIVFTSVIFGSLFGSFIFNGSVNEFAMGLTFGLTIFVGMIIVFARTEPEY